MGTHLAESDERIQFDPSMEPTEQDRDGPQEDIDGKADEVRD